jgi:peptidoglycan DL-endopeptidase CwlO
VLVAFTVAGADICAVNVDGAFKSGDVLTICCASPAHKNSNNNDNGATTHRSNAHSPRAMRSQATSPINRNTSAVPSPNAAAKTAAAQAAAARLAAEEAAASTAAAFAAGEAQGLSQVQAALTAERERLAAESAAREAAIQQQCEARLSAAANASAAQLARVAQSLHALKHDAFVASSRPMSIAPTPRNAQLLSPQQLAHVQLAQQLQTPRSAPFLQTSAHAQQIVRTSPLLNAPSTLTAQISAPATVNACCCCCD